MRWMMIAAGGLIAAPGQAASGPAPVATYWMDVATQSGFGAGITAGGRPSMDQIMGMMSGGGASVARTLKLRLGSKQKPTASPAAEHLPPPTLAMGPSLPLVTPSAAAPVRSTPGMPHNFERPKGRMLIYWGCGEHAGVGQPTIIDFAKLGAGKMPPGMAAMANLVRTATGPHSGSAGYGEWPNPRDNRAVPASGSLLGGHKVQGNYSPPISFALAAGQDFMPALGLAETGALPSGAARLGWRPAPTATGYALSMFGASDNGDVLMWTSSKSAAMSPLMDYLPPAEVKRLIGTGAVLPPSTAQCMLPAEVAAASPAGMVTLIGFGPEANFSDNPKSPKWTAKVRFKTNASLMRGMGAMDNAEAAPAQSQPPRKRKRFGLGDVLQGVLPAPIPQ
ncbi:MAG: hypothetical protein ABIW16_07200 [Sphingomicrobium sp.]